MKLRIKEIQDLKNIKNVDFAKSIETSVQTVIYYRSGFRIPPIVNLPLIAKALDCDVLELFPTGNGFEHYYKNGEWLGIRKK